MTTHTYIVVRADLSLVVGGRDFQTDAIELASELTKKSGKPHIVAKAIKLITVEPFPIKVTDLGED
jgi:hypothetical protein